MKTHITCDCCGGTGTIEEEICITDFTVPKSHDMADELTAIKEDAIKARKDHDKLCAMNPRAKDSYDAQLDGVLEKLNALAESIINPNSNR